MKYSINFYWQEINLCLKCIRTQKFMQTRDTNYIYRNELDKACFQHDMAYGDFKGLKRRTQ